jgi:hypothetical protein
MAFPGNASSCILGGPRSVAVRGRTVAGVVSWDLDQLPSASEQLPAPFFGSAISRRPAREQLPAAPTIVREELYGVDLGPFGPIAQRDTLLRTGLRSEQVVKLRENLETGTRIRELISFKLQ